MILILKNFIYHWLLLIYENWKYKIEPHNYSVFLTIGSNLLSNNLIKTEVFSVIGFTIGNSTKEFWYHVYILDDWNESRMTSPFNAHYKEIADRQGFQ